MIKKYLNTFLISFVILLIIIQYGLFAYFYYVKGFESDNINQVQEVVETFENDSNEKEELLEFYVEIKGAVNSPGVFKVTSDNIINDVINMAGGLKNNAYTKNINLSKNVSKEMVVYVYTNYEYSLLNTKEETTECNCPKQDISVCTNKGASIITSDEDKPEEHFNSDSKSETENNKVNINTSTKEVLTSLSGIGDAKAQNIIDYRNENGLFKSIEDLKNVTGISEKLFEQIKEFITI